MRKMEGCTDRREGTGRAACAKLTERGKKKREAGNPKTGQEGGGTSRFTKVSATPSRWSRACLVGAMWATSLQSAGGRRVSTYTEDTQRAHYAHTEGSTQADKAFYLYMSRQKAHTRLQGAIVRQHQGMHGMGHVTLQAILGLK